MTEAVGIFGGSGLYRLLDDFEELELDTPYGPPSAPIRMGQVEGTPVAFMPRHGDHHELPAHRVNYRANLWAMKEAGVRRIIDPGGVTLVCPGRLGRGQHDPVPRGVAGSGARALLRDISLVTDYDAGLDGKPDVPAVSADEAFRVFSDNLDKLRALLLRAVPTIGPQPDDSCATALSSAIVH